MKRRLSQAITGALAAAAALASAPGRADDSWYTALMGSYVMPDNKRRLDDGFGLALTSGKPLSDTTAAEIYVFGHQADFEIGNDDVTSYGLGLDFNLHASGAGVRPFVLLGLGAQSDDVDGGNDLSPYGEAAIGLMSRPSGELGFRAELRGTYLMNVDWVPATDDAFDARLNVGVVFGGAKPAAVAAAPPPPPMAPPRDSDRDGVMDGTDRCPGTAQGVTVDSTGCAVIEKVVLKGVNFASGSATLKPAAYDTLRSVASAMKVNEELEVRIDGHTDSVGDDARNLALSQRRAQSVKTFLMKEGIAAERLTVKGHGEANPVDTNDTPEGRANNRRVSFSVTGS